MKREQFDRMVQAAHELLFVNAHGTDVDPLTVEWAQQVVKMQPFPPAPIAYRQQAVVAAMADHPPEGMLASEIRAASGLSRRCCAVTLCYMAKHQQIARLAIPGRSRYFRDERSLELGRTLVAEFEQRIAADKVKPKVIRPPRPVPPKPEPRPRTTPVKAARSRGGPRKTTAGLHEQHVFVAATLPPNVHIQALAHQVDRRFIPEPPILGIGAVAQWAVLTRKLRSRGK